MDDVNGLALAPFRDVVQKSSIALDNAGDLQAMATASRSLLKEGERALRRIEPLCKKLLAEHGHSFVVALKQNHELSKYRTQLNGLLWGFEDYIGAEDFDAHVFAQLQTLLRDVAPRIYDILLTMKLRDHPHVNPPALTSQLSPPLSPCSGSGRFSPPVAPLSVRNTGRLLRDSASSASVDSEALSGNRSAHDELDGLIHSFEKHIDVAKPGFVPARMTLPQLSPMEMPPRPPSANPWDTNEIIVSDLESPQEAATIFRRPIVELPANRDGQYQKEPFSHCESTEKGADKGRYRLPMTAYSPIAYRSSGSSQSHYSACEDGSTSDPLQVRSRASSIAESLIDPQPFRISTGPAAAYEPGDKLPDPQPGLESVPIGLDPAMMAMDLYPIPVDPKEPEPPYEPLSRGNCILDAKSSFHLHKGFCKGALEVLKGGIGTKKAKKQGVFSSAIFVARCKNCMFEFDFKQLELDLNRHDEGNYFTNGIGHRLRFLQKSHLATKRVDEVLYGCVFCARMGRTVDESDASVFTSTSALFTHLSRHPRPLPDIPGIAVVEQREVPASLRNNYDVHLPGPPLPHPVRKVAAAISHLPTGVARESARRRPEHPDSLELVAGARITGITWPEEYLGEWFWGWHDCVYAALLTENLRLDPPGWAQAAESGTSQVRARARWRFAPRDKKGWLRFDRGELITNISWSDSSHWCWSGMNARGKRGLFPRDFAVLELATAVVSDGASHTSDGHTKARLSHLSVRGRMRRSPSISLSMSSGESRVGIEKGMMFCG